MGNKPSYQTIPATVKEVQQHPAAEVLEIIVRAYDRNNVAVIVGTKDVWDYWTQSNLHGREFAHIIAPYEAVEDFIEGDSSTLTSIVPTENDIRRKIVRRGNMIRMPQDSSKHQIFYDANGNVEFITIAYKYASDPNTGKEGLQWVYGGSSRLSPSESIVFMELLSQKYEEFLEGR